MNTLKFSIFFSLLLLAGVAHASTTNGTVDSTNKYAWGENLGWVNFAPTDSGSAYAGLHITSTAITGYAWSSVHGWINFSPTNSGQGVTNTSSGVLGGSAWVGNVGWLDMTGVTINSSGHFSGTAGTQGSAVGRVNFDCTNCDVTTDWRYPSSSSGGSQSSGSGSSSSSGGTGYTQSTTQTNSQTNTPTDTPPKTYIPYVENPANTLEATSPDIKPVTQTLQHNDTTNKNTLTPPDTSRSSTTPETFIGKITKNIKNVAGFVSSVFIAIIGLILLIRFAL